MTNSLDEKRIRLAPKFHDNKSIARWLEHARQVVEAQGAGDADSQVEAIRAALEQTLSQVSSWPQCDKARMLAAVRILADLALQRWPIRVADGHVEVRFPNDLRFDPVAEKARVRSQELVKRDEQLRTPAVRGFIQDMERQRLYEERFVSIFSLMRDGRELAEALRTMRSVPRAKRAKNLKEAIDPYIQFVSREARCGHTGLRLLDIWRYFRHTWTNHYTSIPGRTMMFLVRDQAAPMHPIIGIGALSSPIVQIRERDAWIGWHPTTFLKNAAENPTAELGRWLHQILQTALSEIYVDDFLEEEVLSLKELRQPNDITISKLRQFGREQRELHHRFVRAQEHKGKTRHTNAAERANHWVARARSHLFRSKRALSLADLLQSKIVLDSHLSASPDKHEVTDLLKEPTGRRAVLKILRKARADRVGICVADITVCGAVSPYNPIIGGKLVAMLAASPEVVDTYRLRYGGAESEIASSMAGRPIVRPAELAFLGTTSLYGAGSSQYNRIRIPSERLGGPQGEEIRYLQLGRSAAFGTSHYSKETVQQLVELVHHANGGQRVNSIFGEGVSPKLRKIRDGLDKLGFPSDDLLRHGRARIVYGVPLMQNVREYLLGINLEPKYLFSLRGAEATAAIADWWRERWLIRRLESDDVLEQVSAHTLIRPIKHGARVPACSEVDEQQSIFSDLETGGSAK
jgi:hypothetical protein